MLPSSSLSFPALSLLLSLVLVACGGRAASEGTSDGGPEAGQATPASGGGVCCPITRTPCACDDSGSGGWAASAADCIATACRATARSASCTDDHGCPAIGTGDNVPGAACCGCFPPPDSGNPTCTEAGSTWTCPPPYGGSYPQCPATATMGATCTAGSASCFGCQQGAGIECACDASPDGGLGVAVRGGRCGVRVRVGGG